MPDKVKITKTKLDNLANAVAAKSGKPVLLTVDQMTDAVLGINLGEENILEGVKVNNVELPIIDKKVNIPAATVLSSNPGKLTTAGVITQKLWDNIFDSIDYFDNQINNINNAGYITEETDPTVPAWAKETTKPTYTAAEVGALPDTTVIPEDKIFITTFGTTTYADTLEAYNAGKLIFAVYNNGTSNGKTILPLTRKTSSEFQFEGQYLSGLTTRLSCSLTPSMWTTNNTYGNIINRDTDITSGDRLIIRDISDNSTTKSSSLAFGTVTNQYLANNGTWQTVPENVSDLTNDSGYLTQETDPVFSASAAAGITSTDISNWNAKVSDDKTWNGVTLNKTGGMGNSNIYVPYTTSTNASSMNYWTVSGTPTGYAIAKYDSNSYLKSTTPSANDNSTKVATTAYVDAAIPDVSGYVNKSGDTMSGRLTLAYSSGSIDGHRNSGLEFTGDNNTFVGLHSSGYNGDTSSYTMKLRFESGGSNSSRGVVLEGIASPSNSTDAVNKAYVDNAIPQVYSSTNTSGYLTMATLPIYDGTVV